MIETKFFDSLPADSASIREEVFVKEQGFTDEFDSADDTALHLVVYLNGLPVATGRLIINDGTYACGRIAVLRKYRNMKLGSLVMSELENVAKQRGAKLLSLSAQCAAQGFYESCGYTASGSVYLDQHCPHIHMEKSLC